jgi:hypothetical protein
VHLGRAERIVGMSSTGLRKAPFCASPEVTRTSSGLPATISASDSRSWMRSRTSLRWSSEASGPRVPSSPGDRAGFGKPVAQRLDQIVDIVAWDDDAPDGRAFLSGFHRHFARRFLHEQIEFGRTGRCIRPQDGRVQAVGLHGEAHGIGDDCPVRLELLPGPGGAGESHHVLPGHMIEQVADRTGNQLQRAFGQDARLDDAAHHQLGQVGGL